MEVARDRNQDNSKSKVSFAPERLVVDYLHTYDLKARILEKFCHFYGEIPLGILGFTRAKFGFPIENRPIQSPLLGGAHFDPNAFYKKSFMFGRCLKADQYKEKKILSLTSGYGPLFSESNDQVGVEYICGHDKSLFLASWVNSFFKKYLWQLRRKSILCPQKRVLFASEHLKTEVLEYLEIDEARAGKSFQVVAPFIATEHCHLPPSAELAKKAPFKIVLNGAGLSGPQLKKILEVCELKSISVILVDELGQCELGPKEKRQLGAHGQYFKGKVCTGDLTREMASAHGVLDFEQKVFPRLALQGLGVGLPFWALKTEANEEFLPAGAGFFMESLKPEALDQALRDLGQLWEHPFELTPEKRVWKARRLSAFRFRYAIEHPQN